MTKLPNPVLLGVIGAPHGVRGEIRVKPFTADPLSLGDYGPLSDAQGRRLTVEAIRPAKSVVVVRFKEITTREAAEALNGVELFVDRSALPAADDEDEFYHADLIGLEARDETGAPLGRVTAFHDFGAGDIMEIMPVSGRAVLVPFTRVAVPVVDIQAGTVVVDRQAAGLDDGSASGDGE
ncbi:MAG: ribosome maturation factor RimM [Rhizobiaceae bacterium]|nr:ribosome maturation factor RimM [Rhizobiaceae bacterium]MCV0407359.1 ribosome maturation factor RimM [Rhizobiaceae bacterium]